MGSGGAARDEDDPTLQSNLNPWVGEMGGVIGPEDSGESSSEACKEYELLQLLSIDSGEEEDSSRAPPTGGFGSVSSGEVSRRRR